MGSLIRYLTIAFVFLGIGWACKEPFMPNIKSNETNVLVVEGYINVGSSAITTIKLSRTTPVTLPGAVFMESNAQVSIVSNMGDEFFLNEQRAGVYVSDALNLTFDKTYKLKIKTSDAKEYNSAFATPIFTPKIDSL